MCGKNRARLWRDGTLRPQVLATFPGIGPATASSICAFAFNLPVVFIETNIRRVFIHFFFPGADTVTDKEILPLADRALDRDNPRSGTGRSWTSGQNSRRGIPNPNRKSTAYVKQAPFAGSDRRIRGMILKFLIGTSSSREKAIIRSSA